MVCLNLNQTLDIIQDPDEIPESDRIKPKASIIQMYKIIGKKTPSQIAKYDFLMNFGVSVSSKIQLQKAVENACDYEEFKSYAEKIPVNELMMIHKYFTFAVKRMYAKTLTL